MAGYTLGLDIGSNSVGWGLLQAEEKAGIINLGVRVFPEGVDRDTKGLEKSRNATRREARGTRRTHQRRNRRKERLVNLLRRAGLLPGDDSELRSLFQQDAYALRKKGLDDRLEPFQFGRVLYHLSQRRGFKSNRKSGKSKEDGVVVKGANALQAEIDLKKCRTIGEYFVGLNPDEQRIRKQYTFRSMYQQEFDLLWTKQAQFYPESLHDELRKEIRDGIIFFQRPIKPQKESIGDCELETGEKRCPRGDWYAIRFRVLQDVNNLRIQNPDGSENGLSEDQRKTLVQELHQKKEITFDKVREKLGLMEAQLFNLEQEGKVKALKGDIFSAAMRSKNIFGAKRWDAMPEDEKIKLNEAVVELEDDELAVKMKSEYGFDDKQTEAVLKITLPRGYMSFSRKAIQKLLPFMEKGAITSDAIELAGCKRDKTREALDRLPLPSDLRNPIVQKAIVEVRKVVNAVIREYGKPGKIVIEMARDVQGSARQREELHWKMLENKKRNEEAGNRLIEDIKINKPTRDDIIKYKLWEECGHTCPYTGKHISQTALFGPNPEFQIEHILPYDRSLDDSYMNKTLCEVHENIHVKKGQTPFEAYSHDEEKYDQIKQNIKVLPWPKRKKFLQKEIDLDEHIARELNDTRYICREAVKYLKQLGVYVRGSRGKVTSELRHQWGLDGIFDELGTRRDDDHRRHAVDAIVVGVTQNEHLRQLARSKYSVEGIAFRTPWPDFREEVREKVKHINVSHRANRKVSGKLHEETNYGPTGKKDENGQDFYAYRKSLDTLTIPMVDKIVDPVVREIVKDRLVEKGIDIDNASSIPKEVWKEPLYMKTTRSTKKVPIKSVRIHDVKNNVIPLKDASGNVYRVVEPGSNHHVEIFEYTDKRGRLKRDGKVVSMFSAVQRSQKGEAVVQKDHGPDKKFVCSLAPNEMFMLELGDGVYDLYRVQKIIYDGRIVLRPHVFSGKLSDTDKPPMIQRKSVTTLKGVKVAVDPLGRVRPAND
ncbi:MAG: type II CRISPR RNA-guided endonuclease Cas9 [Sedimentisphaerales bacterium]|nr:type II CRISPR RNA-guided endonuclease Cas9 [Sedimentisphaerales bacterium]